MIDVSELTKQYGGRTVVDRVSFDCAPGTITGFLGPNGAGKSTTLRMLCGLTNAASGTATIGGTPYRRLANPGREIGVLLDASAQHSGRTGREVLTLSAGILQMPRQRVGQLLELVGLRDAGGQRVGGYSLGMRQRLGLAHALLGDPRVLVLDEPANGLDPAGIFWLRGLLREFADRGGTVLLSSHLLREVEALADQLVVIGDGQVVARGGRDELLAAAGVRVRARDRQALRRTLAGAGLPTQELEGGALLVHTAAETVGELAAQAGLVLLELRAADGGLEQLFLSLTGDRPTTTDQAQPREHP
ncbi:ATP-binding cassette domain-containing protein [Natronosporangium hydrolyticum]|uniref:ATP-binding cassette domain-containing protein n=1 Tax=Natronosporangium hydrolyticum TaxID=2811111 RepID=A0A895YDJ4_9ACTN|nr:ATP-binding cassette domain-containing protein [Natronosporangium hydrolyticum]QSB12616.1 ATP-binding cassette domain-containing protein [Natronosporangium hydrolyticum]